MNVNFLTPKSWFKNDPECIFWQGIIVKAYDEKSQNKIEHFY